MNRTRFRNNNQLKRNSYIYIILFFLVFLAIFLLLANLDLVVAQHNRPMEQAQQSRTQVVLERLQTGGNAGSMSDSVPVEQTCFGCEVSLLGEDPISERLIHHLDMLKQPWRQIRAEGEVSGLILVADPQLDMKTMNWLLEQNDGGTHLLFLCMPPQEILNRDEIRSRLGIDVVGETRIFPGIRTGKEMMLGDVLEYDGDREEDGPLRVEACDVKLSRQTKVFAHALTEDHTQRDVQDLPPLFWRYFPDIGKGHVYVCNWDFLTDETAYAVLPTVLGDIKHDFIYPIVNAYCVMVDGFPYAENEDRPLWRELYSRDGYGIQREILLSEWERIQKIYGASMTYFSPAREEILNDANEEMEFYHAEFQQGDAELAGKNGNVHYLFSPDEPVHVVPMAPDFSFESKKELRIPYFDGEWLADRYKLFRPAGTIRGLGYVGLNIDVEELLQIEQKAGLPRLFEQFESFLGQQRELYPWLERTTAEEAVERIDTYASVQPVYTYGKSGVTVDLDSIDRDVWFLLRTNSRDPRIDNGTIKEIGENTYLVQISAQTAEITWGSEKK